METRTQPVDQTAAIEALSATLASNLTLHNALSTIPTFDGTNIPLKDYIQTLRNGAQYVTEGLQDNLALFVLNKLEGKAKNSTYGKTFTTIEELVTHLKKRFAQGKTFNYYLNKINNLYMGADEDVADFKDRLTVLLACAEGALKEEKGANYDRAMFAPTIDRAVDIFVRGLPSEMSRDVDQIRPTTLDQAYEEAIRLESRMNAEIIPDLRPRRTRRPREEDREYSRRSQHDDYRDHDDRRDSQRDGHYDKRYDRREGHERNPYQVYLIEETRSREYSHQSSRNYQRREYSREHTHDGDRRDSYRQHRDRTPDRNYPRRDRTPDRRYYQDQDRQLKSNPDNRSQNSAYDRLPYLSDAPKLKQENNSYRNSLNSMEARHTPQVASQTPNPAFNPIQL